MLRSLGFAVVFCAGMALAQAPVEAPQLTALALSGQPGLGEAIHKSFKEKELTEGTAWSGHGPDFFFAVEMKDEPRLVIDDGPQLVMKAVAGTTIWYASAHLVKVGALHAYHYVVDGKEFGGVMDLPAYTSLSYAQPGVPQGTLTDEVTAVSKIYDGMTAKYRVYVPAEYDPKMPAALMVFQDGLGYLDRGPKGKHVLDAIDNLIALKKIPVMICVFIAPGDVTEAPGTPTYKFVTMISETERRTLKDAMRSTEYDTVSDRYLMYLNEEILPVVEKQYNIRKDGYSHAITGSSSGGIAAFNAAWQGPESFSRVLSWIGSFAAIEWKERPDVLDGGQDYPAKVLREPKRNIRVWLQDGANDLENAYGSWPLNAITLANALKRTGYDFHLSFGKGTHNPGQGAAEFPESMMWLWRDYDPAKTEQVFQQTDEEKAKPLFRVSVTNRDSQ